MEPQKIKPYERVADIYAHLMRFINYEEWAEYYYSLTKDYLDKNAKVLELAGGNCKLSVSLKSYFDSVIVTDLSRGMLKQSEVKNIDRVCCNMEVLPFKGKVDLVFSAFDSINYLMTKKSLENTFSEVQRLLSDKGIFSFDVSLERNSLKNVRYLNRKGTHKGIKYFQKSVYDRDKRIHTNWFKLINEQGDTFVEIHKQRIYPLEVFFDILTTKGFVIKECLDAFSFKDASTSSERVQFVVMKDKNHA